PDEQGAVRSPTEIIARLRQLTNDIAGHFGRLKREIIVPIVMRVLDILDQWDLLPTMVRIDNLFVTVRVLSALADTQALDDADRAVRWLATALDILGPEQIDLVADRVRAVQYLHEVMNAPTEVIRTPDETKKNVANALAIGEKIVADQQQDPQNAGNPAQSAPGT
ncbi:MAG: portal protein, partial [Henriciella sp.]|uniref:portal protein n=1 Tax=Henriciella sp. TaxID=1968823 RepID=UPI003C763D1A